MRRIVLRLCVSAIVGSAALAPIAGCSDTGDSSSVIMEPCAAPDGSVETLDSGSGTGGDSGLRTPLGGPDGSVDAGMADGGGSSDASSTTDGTVGDSGALEGGSADGGAHDATVSDGATDGAAADTGAHDTGAHDTGAHDAGVNDASVVTGEGGAEEAGLDPDAICNKETQFTTGCSPTELAFVQHDPTGDCLKCLVAAGAVDDNIFPDTGHECGDLPDQATVAACYATLDCILNTNVGGENGSDSTPPTAASCVDAPNYNISDCYCGAGVATGDCAALTAAPTGQCTAVEAAGLNLPPFPTTPVLNTYTNLTLGSGQANQIFVTAQQNSCTSCF